MAYHDKWAPSDQDVGSEWDVAPEIIENVNLFVLGSSVWELRTYASNSSRLYENVEKSAISTPNPTVESPAEYFIESRS